MTALRQDTAPDHDFRKRRQAHLVRHSFNDRKGRTVQCAGDLLLVEIDERNGLGRKHDQRIDADSDRNIAPVGRRFGGSMNA
jgi:hypothetical protein